METNPTRNHEVAGSILGWFSGLRIQHCCELWWRLQTRLRSGVAVALVWVCGYIFDLTPSLGTAICHGSSPRKGKKTKEKKRKKEKEKVYLATVKPMFLYAHLLQIY